MIGISSGLNQIEEVKQSFTRLRELLRYHFAQDEVPAMLKEIGQVWLANVLQRYDQAIDEDGQAWKPLSSYTLAWKRKRGYPPNLLVRTGYMKRSTRIRTSQSNVVLYNPASYAQDHQNGTEQIPQRSFLGISQDDEEMALERLDALFVRAMSKYMR